MPYLERRVPGPIDDLVLGGTMQARFVVAPGTAGGNVELTCQTVNVTVDPIGNAEAITRTNLASVRVQGWALDPDTAAAINVRIVGAPTGPTTVTANANRTDVGAAYPSYGNAHGFDSTVVTGPGPTSVCIYAVNYAGTPGVDKLLRCQTV